MCSNTRVVKKLKILLADTRYDTVGAHSNYVPIGIGYIGAYLKEKLKDYDIELKLSTKPEEVFDLIDEWKPGVIGLSNYIWNSELSNSICEYAKMININTLCVLGGPEFPAGTGARTIVDNAHDQTYTKTLEFLKQRPSVDYFTYSDGEVAFLEAVKKFLENDCSVKELKKNDIPLMGSTSVSLKKDKLLVGEYIPRIGMDGSVKAYGRDIIPSPYLSGLLDKFLDGFYVPAFETARGCPFQCTFCDQGLDKNKVASFSTERLTQEMFYVGEKMSKLKNGTKTISIFDSNFGLFQKDVDLADHILKVMDKYDWPQYIEAIAPKSNRENILIINDKLRNRVSVGLSMQSLNIETLSDIKRKNWTTDEYVDFIKEVEKRGKSPNSEIIIPLPGETEETYLKGIEFLMAHNVQVGTYTLMMLCGAELGRDMAINRFGMKGKWRILPKQFGNYRNRKTFEVERICIETNTMSFENYLNCRNYSFVVKLLANQIFAPIYKLVKSLDISWYEFSRSLTRTIQDDKYSGKLKDLYNDFCTESFNELFDTKEEAVEFYSKEENYESLMNGDIGENLSAKYTAKSLLVLDEILTTIFYVIKKEFGNKLSEDQITVVNSSEKWLKNLYMIDAIFGVDEIVDDNKYEIVMDFDFPSWVLEKNEPFQLFKKNSKYQLNYDIKKVQYMRNEIKSIYGQNKGYTSSDRAFGRYLMQYIGRGVDVFEKNFQKIN